MRIRAVSGAIAVLLVASALTFAIGPQAVAANPTTWTVDDDGSADFARIQDAIDAANSGDTIVVYPGTYIENIIVNKDHLTIETHGGADVTTVQAADPWDWTFEITTDYVTVSGVKVNGRIRMSHLSNGLLTDNVIDVKGYDSAIYLLGSANTRLVRNIVSSHFEGIHLYYSHSNILSENSVSSSVIAGIYLHESNDNTLAENVATGNCDGIALLSSDRNKLVGNIASWNTEAGIELSYSHDNVLKDNILSNNQDGIWLGNSNGNQLSHTIATHNSYGVFYRRSSSNTLNLSMIQSNSGGLGFWESDNNIIYLNNMLDNYWNVAYYDSVTNHNDWNSPEPIRYTHNDQAFTSYLGNYWYDYLGLDEDGDGIGESPYIIDGDADEYPLVEPFESYIVEEPVVGYAIIVAGQGSWKEAIDHAANNAYRVLRNLGFKDEHIIYLNSNRPQNLDADDDDETDDCALLSQFHHAVVNINNKMKRNPAPFILYLVGHGSRGIDNPDLYSFEFVQGGEDEEAPLFSGALEGMLSLLPEETPMLILVGCCFSGGFITSPEGSISSGNRIIITAAHDDWVFGHVPFFDWAWSSDRFWRGLNNGMNVKDAFNEYATASDVTYRWIDDNGDQVGHSPHFLGDDGELAAVTTIGVPGTENWEMESWLSVFKHSPGELRLYDSQNRVTGSVNGEIKEEIPGSLYDEANEIAVILSPSDSYRYEIAGTETGIYGLDVVLIRHSEDIVFSATDIPTSPEEVHLYIIDWDALSLNEEGVTIQIDADGDGIFEQVLIADNELTYDEYMLQTATTVDLDPDALNLDSEGKWVTAYIELPAGHGYSVGDIDLGSILLNGQIQAEPLPWAIGDYDEDGILDLMVKFDRSLVCAILDACEEVMIVISGRLYDGRLFEGIDKIRVIYQDSE